MGLRRAQTPHPTERRSRLCQAERNYDKGVFFATTVLIETVFPVGVTRVEFASEGLRFEMGRSSGGQPCAVRVTHIPTGETCHGRGSDHHSGQSPSGIELAPNITLVGPDEAVDRSCALSHVVENRASLAILDPQRSRHPRIYPHL
jgi:hypothetical protein